VSGGQKRDFLKNRGKKLIRPGTFLASEEPTNHVELRRFCVGVPLAIAICELQPPLVSPLSSILYIRTGLFVFAALVPVCGQWPCTAFCLSPQHPFSVSPPKTEKPTKPARNAQLFILAFGFWVLLYNAQARSKAQSFCGKAQSTKHKASTPNSCVNICAPLAR
jgi:hypothetical protein